MFTSVRGKSRGKTIKIRERPEVASELLRQARSHKPPRSKGWHQSDHNQCLRKSVIKAVIDRDDLEMTEGLDLMFLRGEGIGAFLSEHTPEDSFFVPDFGYCSIDRPWTDPNGNMVPMELKSTRFSSAYPISEHENYISQLATYVIKKYRRDYREANGGAGVSIEDIILDSPHYGYVYVLYELGDYTDRKPEQRAFEFEFSGEELLEWERELARRHDELTTSFDAIMNLPRDAKYGPLWAMQLEKLGDLLPIEADLEPYLPPVEDHYKWECSAYGECPVKALINCPGTEYNARWGMPFEIESEEYVREHRVRKVSKKK